MLETYDGHITVIKGRFKAGCAMFFKADDFDEVCFYFKFVLCMISAVCLPEHMLLVSATLSLRNIVDFIHHVILN